MAKSRLEIALGDIVECFEGLEKHVFGRRELAGIVDRNRSFWRLAKSTTVAQFIEFMVAKTQLQEIRLEFPSRGITRYTWGEVSLFEVALSLKPDSYLSHYSSVYFHGLTEQIPKTIYVNSEQPPKAGRPAHLAQHAIDLAFSRSPRRSSNCGIYGDRRVCALNGMYTGRLGVVQMEGPRLERLTVTDIERTLIDIAVRPFYSGGISEVLKAYRLAAEKVSVNKLSAMLQKMGFVYPYHQAIGFYLKRAGVYKPSLVDLLRRFPMDFDFYLTYEMGEDLAYSKEWRLFFPKGF
jgi:hypothetical protein